MGDSAIAGLIARLRPLARPYEAPEETSGAGMSAGVDRQEAGRVNARIALSGG